MAAPHNHMVAGPGYGGSHGRLAPGMGPKDKHGDGSPMVTACPAALPMISIWRCVIKPRMLVRCKMDPDAHPARILQYGEEIEVDGDVTQGWVRLLDGAGFALIEHEECGTLLEFDRLVPKPQKAILVRHGEGHHNVGEAYHLLDPGLTQKGRRQAMALRGARALAEAELLVVSPLRRAIETAELVWGHSPQLPTVVTPLHSERVDEPCDEGSRKSALETQFPFLREWGGWDGLPEHWAPSRREDRHWRRDRVPAFLAWLRDRPERCIAVVGHGEFFRGLLEELGDPKSMGNCEVRAVRI